MLCIENIKIITKDELNKGYKIIFYDDNFIRINKRRTIAGLLLLIKYTVCSEADLAGANNRLQEIKSLLHGKIDPTWIQDRYGDANKPFSELWTEEGFSCVRAEGMRGNRQYVLNPKDHYLLFQENAKTTRVNLQHEIKCSILTSQQGVCNICGSQLHTETIAAHTFSKDRVRLEFDHRIPIDRGGSNLPCNFQALCHYCNKSKRQMCFICRTLTCEDCALAMPEKSCIVKATNENILGRMTKK